jgi:hypothetical protein
MSENGEDDSQFRIYNRLERNYNLSDKRTLFLNLKEYYIKKGRDPFDVVPMTYIIEEGTEEEEFIKFIETETVWVEKTKSRQPLTKTKTL